MFGETRNLKSLDDPVEIAHMKPHQLPTGRGRKNINLRYKIIVTNSITVCRKVEIMMGKTGNQTSLLWNNYHSHLTFPPWLNKDVSIFSDIFNNTRLFITRH